MCAIKEKFTKKFHKFPRLVTGTNKETKWLYLRPEETKREMMSYIASMSSHVMVSKSRICRSFKRDLFASSPPNMTKVSPTRVTDCPPREIYMESRFINNRINLTRTRNNMFFIVNHANKHIKPHKICVICVCLCV